MICRATLSETPYPPVDKKHHYCVYCWSFCLWPFFCRSRTAPTGCIPIERNKISPTIAIRPAMAPQKLYSFPSEYNFTCSDCGAYKPKGS